ncbi:hypothetical protein [Nocardia sp. NPDC052566]|uniref:hypothetical protein n=1 Tax=Nocardia sp. NPDC052566 TaxID=3364330 RepID=UPI0037C4F527
MEVAVAEVVFVELSVEFLPQDVTPKVSAAAAMMTARVPVHRMNLPPVCASDVDQCPIRPPNSFRHPTALDTVDLGLPVMGNAAAARVIILGR